MWTLSCRMAIQEADATPGPPTGPKPRNTATSPARITCASSALSATSCESKTRAVPRKIVNTVDVAAQLHQSAIGRQRASHQHKGRSGSERVTNWTNHRRVDDDPLNGVADTAARYRLRGGINAVPELFHHASRAARVRWSKAPKSWPKCPLTLLSSSPQTAVRIRREWQRCALTSSTNASGIRLIDTSLPTEGTRVARCSEIACDWRQGSRGSGHTFVGNSKSQRFPRLGAGAVDLCGGTILDYSSCLTEMSNWTCVGHFI
jgi:hypothetical protein